MNTTIKRNIRWLSSLNDKNKECISSLEKRLANFYLTNPDYYAEINFTSENWINNNEHGYADIFNTIQEKNSILEVGCGSANILKYYPDLQSKYSGCDFSSELLKKNLAKYPEADFKALGQSNILPYENAKFDLVFSVFVIEHSANPGLFLKECVRVVKEDGIIIILCPDFLGKGRMSSQRAGFSRGTTRDKLKQKKYLDALITFFDNKIKIPLYCKLLSIFSINSPRFYINISPTVFSDKFIPDVDAVYLTSKKEMILYLNKNMQVVKNSSQLCKYEGDNKFIYLKMIKQRFI